MGNLNYVRNLLCIQRSMCLMIGYKVEPILNLNNRIGAFSATTWMVEIARYMNRWLTPFIIRNEQVFIIKVNQCTSIKQLEHFNHADNMQQTFSSKANVSLHHLVSCK